MNWTEHFGCGRRETLPSAQLFGNNGVSFRLFQLFRAEKPGGFPSPESGTGCVGSSTALSESHPGGQTGGIEHCALPKANPGGTHSQRQRRVSLRPLGHLGRSAPVAVGQALTNARLSRSPYAPGLTASSPMLADSRSAGMRDGACVGKFTKAADSKFKYTKET